MRVTCISDTHQHHNKIFFDNSNPNIIRSEVLVHAGDFTYHGELKEVSKFIEWMSKQDFKHKVLICGNHEKWISKNINLLVDLCKDNNIILLRNSHAVIEGVKFFGSPYSVEFGPWAYGLPDNELQNIWDCIDSDVDVLITHGPANKRLDLCRGGNVGSKTLANHIDVKLKNLKLHITGHIHESRGVMTGKYTTVNASICGIPYSNVLTNPIVVDIVK